METKEMEKNRVLERAEKKEQRRKEKETKKKAKSLLKIVWKYFTGRL